MWEEPGTASLLPEGLPPSLGSLKAGVAIARDTASQRIPVPGGGDDFTKSQRHLEDGSQTRGLTVPHERAGSQASHLLGAAIE